MCGPCISGRSHQGLCNETFQPQGDVHSSMPLMTLMRDEYGVCTQSNVAQCSWIPGYIEGVSWCFHQFKKWARSTRQ